MSRSLWEPWMARHYGIYPRDLAGFTGRELKAIGRDFTELLKTQNEGY